MFDSHFALCFYRSQIIALKTSDGSKLYESAQMEGFPSAGGTPVTSRDGSLLITTHNGDGRSKGYFTIFQYGVTTPVFAYSGLGDARFGAVGCFWNPTEGIYPEGDNNPNDIFIWALDMTYDSYEVGDGQMFAFQKPLNVASNLIVSKMGNTTSFQTPHPPILTNGGYSMYWSVRESQIKFWQGDGQPRNYFASNATETIYLKRHDTKYFAPGAPVTLSSDPVTPTVYGPSASNQIFRMSWDFSDSLVVNTTSPLWHKVVISPDDMYIYFATAEGVLYQLNATTLETVWNITVGNGVSGDLAISHDGSFVFVADSYGTVTSY
jgi:outer membrane protein assembly factor BamB